MGFWQRLFGKTVTPSAEYATDEMLKDARKLWIQAGLTIGLGKARGAQISTEESFDLRVQWCAEELKKKHPSLSIAAINGVLGEAFFAWVNPHNAAESKPCTECGAPALEAMRRREVRGSFDGLVATFSCLKCSKRQMIALEQVDKKAGVRVRCGFCENIAFVPPSVWCFKCGAGLATGWQKAIVTVKEHSAPMTRLADRVLAFVDSPAEQLQRELLEVVSYENGDRIRLGELIKKCKNTPGGHAALSEARRHCDRRWHALAQDLDEAIKAYSQSGESS